MAFLGRELAIYGYALVLCHNNIIVLMILTATWDEDEQKHHAGCTHI